MLLQRELIRKLIRTLLLIIILILILSLTRPQVFTYFKTRASLMLLQREGASVAQSDAQARIVV